MKKTRLFKAYKKQLKSLTKDFFVDPKVSSKIFILYFKYLRDTTLLQTTSSCSDENILMLNTVIAEFEAFLADTNAEHADFHLQNFYELLKLNQKEWFN